MLWTNFVDLAGFRQHHGIQVLIIKILLLTISKGKLGWCLIEQVKIVYSSPVIVSPYSMEKERVM